MTSWFVFWSLTCSSLLLTKGILLQTPLSLFGISLALLRSWRRAPCCRRSCRCSGVSLALLCSWRRASCCRRSRSSCEELLEASAPCCWLRPLSEASALCCWWWALSRSLRLLNQISLCSAVSSAGCYLSRWRRRWSPAASFQHNFVAFSLCVSYQHEENLPFN